MGGVSNACGSMIESTTDYQNGVSKHSNPKGEYLYEYFGLIVL